MDSFADDVASIHLVNVEKQITAGGLLDLRKKNYIVPLHLQPQTCDFSEINFS